MTPRAFTLHVSDAVLTDLDRRLANVRWPDEPPDHKAWQFGTDLEYLKELVAYWQNGFDWRKQEAKLNAFPQYMVGLPNVDLHFIHVQGQGPRPLPLLLSHGWPGSVWEFHKVIGPL